MADVLANGRAACYKARDAFYACLEKEANKKPTELGNVGLLYPLSARNPEPTLSANVAPLGEAFR
ncbi:uncharacterized protein M6B38_108250 [Iris pallida]|uniref:Uncharacterized protein n=1 Tax=Iris pallida TaxID=29817 RepID=A0AAX6EH91_IRIPA|nr:uncharacterized protein M6B38_108250 [Iris pallida]